MYWLNVVLMLFQIFVAFDMKGCIKVAPFHIEGDDICWGLKKNIVCFRFPTDPIKTCATQIYFIDSPPPPPKKIKKIKESIS